MNKLSNTAKLILAQVENNVLNLTDSTTLKASEKSAFISKYTFKDVFGDFIASSSELNNVHYELKKLWGVEQNKLRLSAPKGKTMVLESVKTQRNGKVIKTYAPIAKPKAKPARKPRKKSPKKVTRKQVRKLAGAEKLNTAEIAVLQQLIAEKLAA
jgi:hypothetical protein